LLKIDQAGMSQVETSKRVAQKLFDRFDTVGILGHGAQTPPLGGCPLSQPHLSDVTLQHSGGIESQLGGALDAVHRRRLLR
jgi:hypothetical protein